MKDTLPARVRFGVFELDLTSGELRNGDEKTVLQEQPLQILRMLVGRGSEIVTREEIKKKLWPNDTIVEFDHSINAAIKNLRRTLGDSADQPKYIETLARRGYRLIVPVERGGGEDSSDPTLSPKGGEKGAAPADGTAEIVRPEVSALIGRKVSHYRVLEVIGGGGMGMVYKAEDLKLGRQVALKFLPDELATNSLALQRFEREARTASSLNHPNICSIHEFGEHDGQPFIVMELMEGQTLRDRLTTVIASAKSIPLEQLLDIAIQVTDGLQAAHAKGIIHRDIKPANIFVTAQGQVKILDFGLAKLATVAAEIAADEVREDGAQGLQVQSTSRLAVDQTLTRTGSAMGTAGYMSPEQVRGEKLDARTDLFSFGLVLYEMATGQRAFSGDTEPLLKDAILNQTPIPVHDLNRTLPPQLEQIINKAMEKDREQRYQSAAELRADLETSEGGAQKKHFPRRWMLLVIVTLVILALVAAGVYWRKAKRATLIDRDTMVLADFANSTGDAVFDGTLKQALAVQLEQSPFLNVLSDQRVNDTLKLMDHRIGEHLTEATAQEVCTRVNGRAVLTGSIAPRGDGYRIALKTLDCQSGDTLATAGAESADRGKVLSALGEAANHLRQKLGESLGSVQSFNKPLEEATTSSLEALQAYTQGRKKQAEQGEAAAIPYFKLAVDLDPNFAYAYVARGTSYFGLFEFKQASADIQRAFDLRDRVTQRERFAIEGYYYDWVTGEQEKMRETHAEWARTYPRDYVPHVRLSAYYRFTGQFEKAVTEAGKAFELAPNNTVSAYYLMMAEFRSNHFDQAKAVLNEAQARKLDSPMLRLGRYFVAFQEHDNKTMEDLVKLSANTPLAADLLLGVHSEAQAYYGRLKLAGQLSDTAADMTQKAAAPERAALGRVDEALWDSAMGLPDRARHFAEEGLSLRTSLDVSAKAALVFALSGDLERAKKMVDLLAKEHPLDTGVQYYSVPMVRAAIALALNKPDEALDALSVTIPYELGGASICCLAPAYLRGLAYLKAGKGSLSATEFQKLLDHPGVVENNPLGALAHLQLGRAQVMMGDKSAARKSYQDFLTLWKDADPDIPVYQQAKAEYAKL